MGSLGIFHEADLSRAASVLRQRFVNGVIYVYLIFPEEKDDVFLDN